MRHVVTRFFRAGTREFYPGKELDAKDIEHIGDLQPLLDSGRVVKAHAPPEVEKPAPRSKKQPEAASFVSPLSTE